jgi:apolipoprotein D and lipocalin family protein
MADSTDLDQRIALSERRLIERQARLAQEARRIAQRVRQTFTAPRVAVPALAGGAALLWFLLRNRRAAPAPAAESSVLLQPATGGMLALLATQLPALLWPMLPAHWRQRANPATVAALLGAGLPLVQRAAAHVVQRPARPRPVANVNLLRYAGTWYEVARLPNRVQTECAGQPVATYTLRGARLEVLNRCPGRDGSERFGRGVARVVRGSAGARLKVSFAPPWLRALPFVWGDYWILHLEPDYSAALVGTPKRDALWLLSRRRQLPEGVLQRLLQTARAQGFDVQRLFFS